MAIGDVYKRPPSDVRQQTDVQQDVEDAWTSAGDTVTRATGVVAPTEDDVAAISSKTPRMGPADSDVTARRQVENVPVETLTAATVLTAGTVVAQNVSTGAAAAEAVRLTRKPLGNSTADASIRQHENATTGRPKAEVIGKITTTAAKQTQSHREHTHDVGGERSGQSALALPVTRSQTRRQTTPAAAVSDTALVPALNEVNDGPADSGVSAGVPTHTTSTATAVVQSESKAAATPTSDGRRNDERPPRQVTWAAPLEDVCVLPTVESSSTDLRTNAVVRAEEDAAVTVYGPTATKSRNEKSAKTRHPRKQHNNAPTRVEQGQKTSRGDSGEQRTSQAKPKKPVTTGSKRRLESTPPATGKKPRPTQKGDAVDNATAVQTASVTSSSMTAVPGGGAHDETDEEMVPDAETTLQLTDEELIEAQERSKMTQKLLQSGVYQGQKVERVYGLVVIHTAKGRRVLLPPSLWAVVLKELHSSIWGGHLKETHTYARVVQVYWWPGLRRAVRRWVRGCQECGSRKARPRQVVPPLRSIRGGDVGDRWALDVAGPFPVASGGERYVVAAVEYVTRYAVATSVGEHTADAVAKFLMQEVVLRFGVFRELLTDGAPEMTGRVIELLVEMLQAKQTTPVPYRPQFIGLVERFNRTWKDCVATMMQDERQQDWELFVRFAVYAYNSAQHTTVALSPNELMLGRKLRSPNDLLRRTEVSEAGGLVGYQAQLLNAMERSRVCAEKARVKEQLRQAKYYDRRSRQNRVFHPGDRVWLLNPPRGPKATKFVHQWMGPMKVIEPAGYDNFLLQREDKTGESELMIAHVSFMLSYHFPSPLLQQAAADIVEQLRDEDQVGGDRTHGETARAAVRAAAARSTATPTRAIDERNGRAAGCTAPSINSETRVVELRRRRRRNRAGQYALEYELRRTDGRQWCVNGKWSDTKWVGVAEYDRWFDEDRVVETPDYGEVV